MQIFKVLLTTVVRARHGVMLRQSFYHALKASADHLQYYTRMFYIPGTQFTSVLPLPSARQHQSYGDCLEVKREYYQNSSVLDCVTQCSQSTAHLSEQFLQVKQIGFVTLGPLRRV